MRMDVTPSRAGVSSGTSSSAGLSEKTDKQDKKEPEDIFAAPGALQFPRPAMQKSPQVQLQGAKRLLEIMRVPNELTFGGNVSAIDVDPVKSLRNYYQSLELARRVLAACPEARPAVERLVRSMSTPDDLRESIAVAAGLGKTSVGQVGLQSLQDPLRALAKMPPTKPMGTASVLLRDIQDMYNRVDAKLFTLSDVSIELLMRNYQMRNLASRSTTDAWHLGLMRTIERALDAGIGIDQWQFNDYINFQLPRAVMNNTAIMDALACVMHRAQWDENVMNIDRQNCLNNAQYVAAKKRLKARLQSDGGQIVERRPPTGSLQAAPLGPNAPGNGWVTDPRRLTQTEAVKLRDPKNYQVNDATLRQALKDMPALANLVGFAHTPLVFSLYARGAEIEMDDSLPGNCCTQVITYLRSTPTIPTELCTDVGIPFLVRMANAVRIPLSDIYVRVDGRAMKLSEHPALATRRGKTADVLQWASAQLATLDPAHAPTAEQQSATLTKFFQDQPLEFQEALSALAEARANGKLAPLATAGLPEESVNALAQAIFQAWHHVAGSALLLGMLTDLPAKSIEALLLTCPDFDAQQVQTWTAVAESLQKLSGRNLTFVCADALRRSGRVDLTTMTARMALVNDAVNEANLARYFTETSAATSPSVAVTGLLERAALEPAGSTDRATILQYLRDVLRSGGLSETAVREAGLDITALAESLPDIMPAVRDFLNATGTQADGAMKQLVQGLQQVNNTIEREALVEHALKSAYKEDLASVLPLSDADAQLGGVTAKAPPRVAVAPTGPTVTVAGLTLAACDAANKDLKAIPRQEHADLVLTRTTEDNLRLLGSAWLMQRPVLLEGPTSAGKTAAVRYMAWKTGTPYRRINLSYHTDVEDLVGRYVGAEKRYDKETLEKRDDAGLAAAAQEFDLPVKGTRDEQIAAILTVQDRPRWVDGPVVKAMKRGEVLLLDEINLARPAVLERLNSLFDDDGNLVLTEHRNEVVAAHKSFRIFATMNPASYAGREQLSEAMRSRWNHVFAHDLTTSDLTKIMQARYGDDIPAAELAKLIAVHKELSRAADEGILGRKSGGIAFTLRNLFKVADRFVHFRKSLPDADLMARETGEVYLSGFFDDEEYRQAADVMTVAMPGDSAKYYSNLKLEKTPEGWQIGDVLIRSLDTKHHMVPKESELIMTTRTKTVLYGLAKALEMGENVGLIGEKASGKTAIAKMYAQLRGQPYYRQLFSASSDTSQLVGGYDDMGWKDGLLLSAGRPDNTAGVFLADELNLASPAVLERLNPVLDDERKVVLAEKEGEEIKLNPDFRFIAAMNPPTKNYGGRQKLSKAMQNRLTMIWVPGINDEKEQAEIALALGKKWKVPAPITQALLSLHTWVSKAFGDKGIYGAQMSESKRPVYSIRQLLKALQLVAKLSESMDFISAYLLAVEAQYASVEDPVQRDGVVNQARELAR